MAFQLVTTDAIGLLDELASQSKDWGLRNLWFFVALATGCFHILLRKNRLVPVLDSAERFLRGCCGTLTFVAYGAAEIFKIMMDVGMRTEGLLAFCEELLFQPQVARDATIDPVQFSHPNLFNPDVRNPRALRQLANETVVFILVPFPLLEIILEWRYGKHNEKNDA